MPIKPELRWFYPIDWPEISRRVRFERAGGLCEGCGRPHGESICCLSDGRWLDPMQSTWRNGRGRPARWPSADDAAQIRWTHVVLAAAHLDHDPGNNTLRNLRALCQRCHLLHDRSYHLERRRVTYLMRRALGDLFLGPYSSSSALPGWRSKGSTEKSGRHGLHRVVLAGHRPQARRYAAPFGALGLDRAAQQGLELGVP